MQFSNNPIVQQLLDNTLKDEADHASIGIILCRDNKKLTVEYSLENMKSPVGVSTYTLTSHLPKKLGKSLPTPEEWSKRINLMMDERDRVDKNISGHAGN